MRRQRGLRNTILDNWLVNVMGELGKVMPGDLHQEHYNCWLKDMVQRHVDKFDGSLYRETILPNVEHFLRFKEEIETCNIAANLTHLLISVMNRQAESTVPTRDASPGRSDSPAPSSQSSHVNFDGDEIPTRSDSPASSSSGGEESYSGCGSTGSAESAASLDSVLSAPDPNKPEDDGVRVDMSYAPRSCRSSNPIYVDPETGLLQHDEEEERDE
ncbi:hypothetical protein C8R44DRAFT_732894 [Mycena epipterygia]|nr:hypothetical protein C8R44DRAFT_732894 [Mycena epipterygia]